MGITSASYKYLRKSPCQTKRLVVRLCFELFAQIFHDIVQKEGFSEDAFCVGNQRLSFFQQHDALHFIAKFHEIARLLLVDENGSELPVVSVRLFLSGWFYLSNFFFFTDAERCISTLGKKLLFCLFSIAVAFGVVQCSLNCQYFALLNVASFIVGCISCMRITNAFIRHQCAPAVFAKTWRIRKHQLNPIRKALFTIVFYALGI